MKHLHMTIAFISVALFTLRFVWTIAGSAQLNKKWVKITPHVIDTILLLLGGAMMMKLALNPLEQLWLGEKLIGVVAYIFTGYYTLKLARNRTMQIIGYLGAMGWFLLVARLAMSKENLFF
ncbi:MAG: SirB2 family protein [Colwelliaceae bacterium]|nr:SirB2 family protein [Colwelliaceae bacterium]